MNTQKEKNEISFYKQKTLEIIEGRGLIDLPYHTHNSYVIGVITSGKLQLCIKEQEYHVGKGAVFIDPSNVGISLRHETSFSYRVFCFSHEAADYFNSMQPEELVVNDIGVTINELYEKYKKDGSQRDFMKSLTKVLNFTPKADMEQNSHKSSDPKRQLVQQAVNFMEEHVDDKCSIEEVADRLYVSKYYFSRIFKDEMDITPKQYMMQAKLRRAKELILEEGSSTKVAEDMEYAAQSHLCSIFKKYMGISIGDYKKHLTIYNE